VRGTNQTEAQLNSAGRIIIPKEFFEKLNAVLLNVRNTHYSVHLDF